MTNPGDPIAAAPSVHITAMTADLRAMLRVLEAFGLGHVTVVELLDEVERLDRELAELRITADQ